MLKPKILYLISSTIGVILLGLVLNGNVSTDSQYGEIVEIKTIAAFGDCDHYGAATADGNELFEVHNCDCDFIDGKLKTACKKDGPGGPQQM